MSKAENMVPYCARMPRGLLEQAKAAARAEGMGLSELVRFLLREYVRREVSDVPDEAKAADELKKLDYIAEEYGEGHRDGFDALVMRRVIAELTREDWVLVGLANVTVALHWAGTSVELRHADGCTARLQFVTAGCEADLWPSTLEVAGRVVIDHGVSWEIAANEAETDARQALARWLVDARWMKG